MFREPFQHALILTGPTGSGKTRLGIELAQRLGAEIISMDSMALYRGMDIGTAKPSAEDRQRVPHHLIDVLEPWESSSVAWWLERAAGAVRDIEARGKHALFVGGTPLYLKALLFGLFEGPAQDEALRQRLTLEAEQLGAAALHERLAKVDSAAAGRIHPQDLRRVIRALEIWELTGRPISAWQTQWSVAGGQRPVETVASGQCSVASEKLDGENQESASKSQASATSHWPLTTGHCLWLDLPREELYAGINRRVEEMFAAGLVEEVRVLRGLSRPLGREAGQALGYKEVFALLDGQATLSETIERVQIRSRQFAKRQLTWFRHLPGCRPVTRELTANLWGVRMD